MTTEEKKPVGRPALVEVLMLARGNATGEMINKGEVAKVPREVARKWQDNGVCKVVI